MRLKKQIEGGLRAGKDKYRQGTGTVLPLPERSLGVAIPHCWERLLGMKGSSWEEFSG